MTAQCSKSYSAAPITATSNQNRSIRPLGWVLLFLVSLILFTHLPFRAEPLIGAFGQDDPACEGLDGGGDGIAGGALAVGGGYDGAPAIHRAEGDGLGPAVEKIGLSYTLYVLILIMLHEHSFCCAAD